MNGRAGSGRFVARGRYGALGSPAMTSPRPARTDPRPRRIAGGRRRDACHRSNACAARSAEAAGRAPGGAARRPRPGHRQGRAAAVAVELGDAPRHRDRQRADQLHRDRRHAVAARPVGRAHRGGVLRRLCRRTSGSDQTAGDVRVQRRAGRGVGLSASRPRRSAPRRIPRRPRGPAAAARQSADLAAVHRSGDDRSGRIGLQPHRQSRRRQRVLGRGARRRVARQGDRAVDRRQPPLRVAEIHSGRELRRLPRRQGGARAAPRRTASPSPAS